jgi:DNA-directed RNA polymerase specialized sigma24 family protein
MAIPPQINKERAEVASHRDADLGLLVLAVPRLYASLTDQQAEVLRARAAMPGRSWTEVADSLGMSRHAAMARWRRGMQRLPDMSSADDLMAMNTNLWNVAF